MMIKHIFIYSNINIFLVQGCTGTYEKNIAELDEIYGVCDNPTRNYKKGSKMGELHEEQK